MSFIGIDDSATRQGTVIDSSEFFKIRHEQSIVSDINFRLYSYRCLPSCRDTR